MSTKITALVRRQEPLAKDVFSLTLYAPEIAKEAVAGQFVSIYCNDGARLLPRPISLCEIDKKQGTLRLVYRIAGKGTREFSFLRADKIVEIMGPLGNGFPLKGKKAILIGGGIGIPPMLELAKELDCEKSIVTGFRDETFLTEDLEKHGTLYIASEDGKTGVKGTVLDAVREYGIEGDIIYACGPIPMLKAVKAYGAKHNVETYLSLEEKMACGIGACLACVCQSRDIDGHSHVHNKRVCKDGPVFLAEEVLND